MSIVANVMSFKNQKEWQRVDPDEMADNEPSHQDLHCLRKYLTWSIGLKGLIYCS